MRIGFDARYISHGLIGGVRSYVYHLAAEMPSLARADEFFLYADAKAPFELASVPPNVTVRMLPWRSSWSTVVNDIRIARWMERDRIDVAHFPANYGPNGAYAMVVTVHDALNLFPMSEHWRGFGKRPRQVAMMAYLGWKTRQSLAAADVIVTTSEHARTEITRRSGCRIDRITAIHEAAGAEFREITDPLLLEGARRRLVQRQHLILADGIKNPGVLIEAYGRLEEPIRSTTELLFFSRESTPRAVVAAALATPGIKFLARPTTDDLVLLMNLASVFVFPSWYEGFGLPLVEAMQCGVPIVASSRGSIPEILGGASLLFDIERSDELARHLNNVLESEPLRAELQAQSRQRSRAFSWRTTADHTLAAYGRAAKGRTQFRRQ